MPRKAIGLTRAELQEKAASEYQLARAFYANEVWNLAADVQATAAKLSARTRPRKPGRPRKGGNKLSLRMRLVRAIEQTLASIDADLAESDMFGYSHQSNNHIRGLIEPLRAVLAQSQDQRSKRSQKRSRAGADESTIRS